MVNVEFEWNKRIGGHDCGVYVMSHCRDLMGSLIHAPILGKSYDRKKCRGLYCVHIALVDTNDFRFDVHKSVLGFMNRRKK
ncbi:hypothetical protein C2S52_008560 [Perilla frutescens var. hirtella]|uniref:Uncharacterized protein n=1 Tax=Perilla frutescens var. hirtella TaxID=608512 RepID=A0AAD4JNS3_PERFH|nr:hypothetical protein C2S51_017727 [Perilla frutescens var. frutescens]KAH6783601.1 hypothetical protein C2S52_008560 [Perilla frutescens var. hirtella]KAH6836385.1 hypothetical protein C2S53_011245 [Perilla frutescens var. hirtella]